MIKRSTS